MRSIAVLLCAVCVNAVAAWPEKPVKVYEIMTMSPAEFGAFMRKENARWVKVVKDAGITPQ